jgi:hypothetical protein
VLFRQPTQTFGVTVVSQTGLAAGHCALVWHWSMLMTVGGWPGALPLPSVGVVVDGAPSMPDAVMFAWFEMVPDAVASTVTRNFTTLVPLTASVPPVVAVAPAPRRAVSVLVPAVKLT